MALRTFWILALAVAGGSSEATLRYRMLDLGPPVNQHRVGRRVNSAGTVTTRQVWLFKQGHGWGQLPCLVQTVQTHTADVNERNDVAVHIQGEIGNDQNLAAVFLADGRFQRIGMPPGMIYENVYGMNDAGEVVGGMRSWPGDRIHGWLYRPGTGTIDLGETPEGYGAIATDINRLGTVLGVHMEPTENGQRYSPHLWVGGSLYVNLGRPPGRDFFPTAINSSGDIVGWSSYLDAPQMRRSDGTWVYVTVPGKLATATGEDINDDGWVVGAGAYNGQSRAYLWRPGIGTQLLEELVDASGAGFTFLSARGISSNGSITGSAKRDGDPYPRSFLLAPYED